MKKHVYYIIAAVIALLAPVAAADRVLPLHGGAKIVICHGEVLTVLDVGSGEFKSLGKAWAAAYDPLSDHLIACSYQDGRTTIRILSVKDDFKEVEKTSIALRVYRVEWAGVADRFYICGTSAKAKKEDVFFCDNLIIEFDEQNHFVMAHAVPGLSDLIDIPGAGGPIVNSVRPGTFAFSADVANPELLGDALKAADSEVKSRQPDTYLVITKSWRPWRAWSLVGISMAFPVGFSEDGQTCLIRVSFGMDQPQLYRIFDLDNGHMVVCDWLINPMEVVASRGDLGEEIVSVDNSTPVEDRWPELKKLFVDLAAHGASQSELSQANLLIEIGGNTPAVLLGAYRDSPTFAGAYCREKESYFVSDGTRLMTISHGKIAAENRF
jgi:hypothetical protein